MKFWKRDVIFFLEKFYNYVCKLMAEAESEAVIFFSGHTVIFFNHRGQITKWILCNNFNNS